MAILDIGCGTGAITRGIAEAVGPNGRVSRNMTVIQP